MGIDIFSSKLGEQNIHWKVLQRILISGACFAASPWWVDGRAFNDSYRGRLAMFISDEITISI